MPEKVKRYPIHMPKGKTYLITYFMVEFGFNKSACTNFWGLVRAKATIVKPKKEGEYIKNIYRDLIAK